MKIRKKVIVLCFLLVISVMMMFPMIVSASSSGVSWHFSTWVDGHDRGNVYMHTLDAGTAELSGNESISTNYPKVFTVYAQLCRIRANGNIEYYGRQELNDLVNGQNEHFDTTWSTDCYCVNYYLVLDVDPQTDNSWVTGTGTLSNQ